MSTLPTIQATTLSLRYRSTASRARWLAPLAVALAITCVWLNQSVGGDDWEAYRQGVIEAPSQHVIDTLRYPFAYLYKRGSDVQLYYQLANLFLGRRADTAFVTRSRGELPPRFRLPYPPADGRWHAPYAEVMLEYPVLAVPLMVAPRLLVSSSRAYGFAFGVAMGLMLVAAIAVALDAARAAGENEEGLRLRGWLACALLLAQGGIAVQRLDAATALLLALALRAAVLRKPFAFGIWAGLATATKFVPALLIPTYFGADPKSRQTNALVRFAAAFALTCAVGILPMFACSTHALSDVIAYHSARGLNCESTLGFLLALWRLVTGTRVPTTISFGSYNLPGRTADALGWLCGPLSVAAVLALAFALWKRSKREDGGELPIACAAFASLLLLWLTAKVFSTQYMTWGIPVVLAIPGRLGVRLAWLLVASMGLTQLYVIGHHELVMQGTPLGLLNLGARDAFLGVAAYFAIKHLVGQAGHGERRSPAERALGCSGSDPGKLRV